MCVLYCDLCSLIDAVACAYVYLLCFKYRSPKYHICSNFSFVCSSLKRRSSMICVSVSTKQTV